MAHGDKISVEFGAESMRLLTRLVRAVEKFNSVTIKYADNLPVPQRSHYQDVNGDWQMGNWDQKHDFVQAAVDENVCVCGRGRSLAMHLMSTDGEPTQYDGFGAPISDEGAARG